MSVSNKQKLILNFRITFVFISGSFALLLGREPSILHVVRQLLKIKKTGISLNTSANKSDRSSKIGRKKNSKFILLNIEKQTAVRETTVQYTLLGFHPRPQKLEPPCTA